MSLLNGIHHVATLTRDLDRLIGFYQRVFDARVTLDLTEEWLRHAFIEVGPSTVLHPFEAPFLDVPEGEIPMFRRGRLDHVAFNAASEEAFWEVRRRVRAEEAGIGDVIDMGMMLNFGFADPDGAEYEVVWITDAKMPQEETVRSRWTIVPEE